MTNITTTERKDANRNSDPVGRQDESRERLPSHTEESNIEHVEEKGLPPGIEKDDLFNPNGKRPRGVPNGDNS